MLSENLTPLYTLNLRTHPHTMMNLFYKAPVPSPTTFVQHTPPSRELEPVHGRANPTADLVRPSSQVRNRAETTCLRVCSLNIVTLEQNEHPNAKQVIRSAVQTFRALVGRMAHAFRRAVARFPRPFPQWKNLRKRREGFPTVFFTREERGNA
jgi:hypothetical protein